MLQGADADMKGKYCHHLLLYPFPFISIPSCLYLIAPPICFPTSVFFTELGYAVSFNCVVKKASEQIEKTDCSLIVGFVMVNMGGYGVLS